MSTNRIEDIYNFLKISDSVATAGQPTEAQLPIIQAAGYQVVVNLALSDSPNALPDEQAIVESLGMQYIHIPVIWEKPTPADINRFFHVMAENTERNVFVHCAANKRVSVFIYLYRVLHQGINGTVAKEDLQKIWTPNEIWQNFIQEVTGY